MRHAGHHRELLTALAKVETATSELRAIATRENTEFLPDAFRDLDQAVSDLLHRFAPTAVDTAADDQEANTHQEVTEPVTKTRPTLALVGTTPQPDATPGPDSADVTKLVTKEAATPRAATPDRAGQTGRSRRSATRPATRRPRVDPDTVWVDKKPGGNDRHRVLAPGDGDEPLLIGYVQPTYSATGRRNGWQALTDQLIPVRDGAACRTRTEAMARLLGSYLR